MTLGEAGKIGHVNGQGREEANHDVEGLQGSKRLCGPRSNYRGAVNERSSTVRYNDSPEKESANFCMNNYSSLYVTCDLQPGWGHKYRLKHEEV